MFEPNWSMIFFGLPAILLTYALVAYLSYKIVFNVLNDVTQTTQDGSAKTSKSDILKIMKSWLWRGAGAIVVLFLVAMVWTGWNNAEPAIEMDELQQEPLVGEMNQGTNAPEAVKPELREEAKELQEEKVDNWRKFREERLEDKKSTEKSLEETETPTTETPETEGTKE